MKILYLHQYFITPDESGGARSYYLAKKLVESGKEVVVITSNTRNKEWSFVETKNVDGIRVIYIKNMYDSNMSKYTRILSFLKFLVYSSIFALMEKSIDVVYASSTPISIGVPALAVKYVKGARFILELRDTWPDVPYELGYIKTKSFYQAMKKFEAWLYNAADKIITISEGIKILVGETHQHKTFAYPFGSNLELFSTDKNNVWKEANGINAPVLYVYTGAIGIANGMQYLVEAAKIIQDSGEQRIHIAVIGEGSAKKDVSALISKYNLTNMSMHEPVSVESLNGVYASAAAGIILFSDKSRSYRFTASPNKFFDYIAAGLPPFFNFSGPLKTAIVEKGIGTYSDYKNPGALSNILVHHAGHPDELERMSRKARICAETEYNRDKILTDLVAEISNFRCS